MENQTKTDFVSSKSYIALSISIILLTATLAGAIVFANTRPTPNKEPIAQGQTVPTATPNPTLVITNTAAPAQADTPTPTPDQYSGWNTYKNTRYGFELRYPNTLKLVDEGLRNCDYVVDTTTKGKCTYVSFVDEKTSSALIVETTNKADNGTFMYGPGAYEFEDAGNVKFGSYTIKKTLTISKLEPIVGTISVDYGSPAGFEQDGLVFRLGIQAMQQDEVVSKDMEPIAEKILASYIKI